LPKLNEQEYPSLEAQQNINLAPQSADSDVQSQSPFCDSTVKLLYGVQGTGHGHISRASAMNKALNAQGGFDVAWVMSGRTKQKLMCCDEYQWYRGMTFTARDGKIHLLDTITDNNVPQFFKDIRTLALDDYDLIVTDFEPVVSWAAKKQGREIFGIGHQYAFYYPMPMAGKNFFAEMTMKYFAPATHKIGLHWHHFDQPILPPIVDMHAVSLEQKKVENKVLVYLPFENQDALVKMLAELPDWNFYIYHADMEDYDCGNLRTRAISKTGFKNDLVTASALITNSGFELISECLTLGKKILTKPLQGQIEQLSNAKALSELCYATVCSKLDKNIVKDWLASDMSVYRVNYPDVAAAIAQWLGKHETVSVEQLSADLWEQTSVQKLS